MASAKDSAATELFRTTHVRELFPEHGRLITTTTDTPIGQVFEVCVVKIRPHSLSISSLPSLNCAAEVSGEQDFVHASVQPQSPQMGWVCGHDRSCAPRS